jgi:hypothetical protein
VVLSLKEEADVVLSLKEEADIGPILLWSAVKRRKETDVLKKEKDIDIVLILEEKDVS